MAIQAHMYPNNLGAPLQSQDWLFMSNNTVIPNNIDSSFNNNNMLFNGCGVNEMNLQNFQQKFQQQQQQQQVQYQQQQQYLMPLHRNSSANNSYMLMPSSKKQYIGKPTTTKTATTASTTTSESEIMSMNISRSLSAELEKQGQEIDRFVAVQNEMLRLALQKQRKQQLCLIISKLEEKANRLIQQKDDEIVEATKKSLELQEIIRKMELENQVWQKIAADNEQMVLNLNYTLEEIQQQQQQQTTINSACSSNCVDDDAESCCNLGKRKREDGVAQTGANRGETQTRVLCRVCNFRDASILLLPCRHMCCCKSCEAFLDTCPVCASTKMATIEALVS